MVYPFYTERRNVSRPVQRCVPGMLRLWNDPRPYRHIYTYLDPCMLPIFCQYETTILHVLVNTRKILDLIFDDHLTSHHSRTYQAKFEWVGRIISAKHREWSGVRPIEKPSSFAKFLILGWIFAKSRNNPIWNHAHTIYGTGIFGSRSKVLNKNFNLGGTQPTLLYDFTSSLCGVTQGNPAKHKLGARFAQGWRKCFHVLSWYISFTYNIFIYIYNLYILSYIVCI